MSSSESPISIRKVTDLHANWSDQGADQNGKISFQLILDNGAVEVVIRPTAKAAKALLGQFVAGDSFYFDTDRQVLLLRGLK